VCARSYKLDAIFGEERFYRVLKEVSSLRAGGIQKLPESASIVALMKEHGKRHTL